MAQAVDFDFHEIAFAVPLLAFALWALLEDRSRTLVVCCFLLLLCKEDIGLTFVLPIGIAVILRGRIRFGGSARGDGRGRVAARDLLDHPAVQRPARLLVLEPGRLRGATTGVAHGNAVGCLSGWG